MPDAAACKTCLGPRDHLHLQSVGPVRARPASDIAPGDVLLWNHGSRETVVAVEPKGAASLAVSVEYEVRGFVPGDVRTAAGVRTLRRDRLVAVGSVVGGRWVAR